jgi:hypothetical protein
MSRTGRVEWTMTNPLMAAALAYAERNWRVLPIKPRGKIPITAHGKDDATTNAATIRKWWQRTPNANIGIATGAASGFIALDIDAERGGLETLARLQSAYGPLPSTLTAITGGGGRHLLFAHPGRSVTNRTNIARGLDVRGDGGYIVVAPSAHPSGRLYQWEDEKAPISQMPGWLLALVCPATRTTPASKTHSAQDERAVYAEAALRGELANLERTVEGDRNNQLNKSAFALGQFIGAGLLDPDRVEAELTRVALAIGLNEHEIQASIRSGIEAGMREPRQVPDRAGTASRSDVPSQTNNTKITAPANEQAPTVEEELKVLEQIIEQVPADTDKVHLPILLRPLLEKLARLDRSLATAFLHHKLKPRFGLTYTDVRAYASDLTQIREESERTEREHKAQEAAAAQEAAKRKEMSEDERAQAMAFLQSPDIIEQTITDLTALGHVGEDTNKLLVYCVATSRKQDRPLSAIIKSPSAFGKSELLKTVAALLPPEDVLEFTRLTPQALAYLPQDALKNKFLIVMEHNGSEASDYNIRIMQSERKIRIAYPVKDPETGEMHTAEREVNGPLAYAETTTRPTIHAENATRVFELYLDGSARQTVRIHEAQRTSVTLEGMRASYEREAIRRRHQDAQRLLQPVTVLIPYAPFIHFPAENPRTRRDLPRFLETIQVIAFLKQYQKERKKEIDRATGEAMEYIEADLDDYAMAYRYAAPSIAYGLDELPKHSRDLLAKIVTMMQEQIQPDVTGEKLFTRRDIRQYCRVTDKFVKDYILSLEDKEYLEIVSGGTGKGKKIVYKLSKAAVNSQDSSGVVKGLTTPEELAAALQQPQSGPRVEQAS